MASSCAWLSIPASLLYAKISEQLRDKRLLVLSLFIASAASIAGIVFTSSYTGLLLLILLYSATGKIASDPIIIAQVPDFVARERLATVFGICNFIGMSASIIATLLPAELKHMGMSWNSSFLSAAAVLLIAGGLSLLMPSHEHSG